MTTDEVRWRLTVVLDPMDVQVASDPETEFPNDELSRFVRFLGEYFDTLTEDLIDMVEFSHKTNTAIVRIEIIDPFDDIFSWLVMHTNPRSLTLERMEDR